jgi:hypothetical protein
MLRLILQLVGATGGKLPSLERMYLGNCRPKTKSALRLSPFRSPSLPCGRVIAVLPHVDVIFTLLVSASRTGQHDDLCRFVGEGAECVNCHVNP